MNFDYNKKNRPCSNLDLSCRKSRYASLLSRYAQDGCHILSECHSHLLIVLVFIFLLCNISCIPKQLVKHDVTEYNTYLAGLDTLELGSILKSRLYLQFYLTDSIPKAKADTVIAMFRSFYFNFLDLQTKGLLLNDQLQAKLRKAWKLKQKDIPRFLEHYDSIFRPRLVSLVPIILDSSGIGKQYWILRESPGYFIEAFKSFISPAFNKFLSYRKQELEEELSKELDIDTLLDRLGQRIVNWERFINDYPDFILRDEVAELIHNYTCVFLNGLNDNQFFDIKTGIFNPNAARTYLEIIERYPNAKFTELVKKYHQLLLKGNFKWSNIIEDFLNRNEVSSPNIAKHYFHQFVPRITLSHRIQHAVLASPVTIQVSINNPIGIRAKSSKVLLDEMDITNQLHMTKIRASGMIHIEEGEHILSVIVENSLGFFSSFKAKFLVFNFPDFEIPPNPIAEVPREFYEATGMHSNEIEVLRETENYAKQLPFAEEFANTEIGADISTHAMTIRTVDFESRGRGGLDFKLERIYSTHDAYWKSIKPQIEAVRSYSLWTIRGKINETKIINALMGHLEDYDLKIWMNVLKDVTRSWCKYKDDLQGRTGYWEPFHRVNNFKLDPKNPLGIRELLLFLRDYNYEYSYEKPGQCKLWRVCCEFRETHRPCIETTNPEAYSFYPNSDWWRNCEEPRCVEWEDPETIFTSEPYVYVDSSPGVPAPKFYATLYLNLIESLSVNIKEWVKGYDKLIDLNSQQRKFSINSGFGIGWTLNLPFIEFPHSTTGHAGYVYFDGYRPRKFTALKYSEFPKEEAILQKLLSRRITTGELQWYPTIDGVLRTDVRYWLSIKNLNYYFNNVGQLRFITDPTHNNYIEVVWSTTHPNNEDALRNGRIDHITDAAGNTYRFTYLSDDEILKIRREWARRFGVAIINGVPLNFFPAPAPPLIGSIKCEQTGRSVNYLYESHDLRDAGIPRSGFYTNSFKPGLHEQLVLRNVEVHEIGYQGQSNKEPDPNIAATTYRYKGIRCFDCGNYFTERDETVFYCQCPEQVNNGGSILYGDDAVVYSVVLTEMINPYGGHLKFQYNEVELAPEFKSGQGLPFVTNESEGEYDFSFYTEGTGFYSYMTKPVSIKEIWRHYGDPKDPPKLISSYSNNYPGRLDEDRRIVVFTSREFDRDYMLEEIPPIPHRTWTHKYERIYERINEVWELAERRLDGDKVKKEEEYQYDNYGNTKQITTWRGDGEPLVQQFNYPPLSLRLTIYGTPTEWYIRDKKGSIYKRIKFSYNEHIPWLLESIEEDSTKITYDYHNPTETGSIEPSLKPRIVTKSDERTGNKIITTYHYDQYGNVDSLRDELGEIRTFTYHNVNNLPSVFLEQTTSHGDDYDIIKTYHNSIGQLTYYRNARGFETTYQYDAIGRLKQVDTPKERFRYDYKPVVEYKYYPTVAVPIDTFMETHVKWAPISNPDSTIELLKLRPNAFGKVLKRTDIKYYNGIKNPIAYSFLYDLLDRPKEVLMGHPDESLDGYLVFAKLSYDALNRLSSLQDQRGSIHIYEYLDALLDRDGLGEKSRQIKFTDPANNTTSLYLDGLYRPIYRKMKVDNPGKPEEDIYWRYKWDSRNRLVWTKSPMNVVTQNVYDGFDRLIERHIYSTSESFIPGNLPPDCSGDDSNCFKEVFEYYDDINRMKLHRNANGNETVYNYDEFGRLEKVIEPLGRITEYSYDAEANIDTISRYDEIQTFTYDYLNRLTDVKDPEGNLRTFQYDLFSEITHINDFVTDHVTGNLEKYTKEYKYGILGNIVEYKDEENNIYNWSFDKYGRLWKSSEPRGAVADIRYDTNNAGDIIGITRSDNGRYHYLRDGLGRLVSVSVDRFGKRDSLEYNSFGKLKSSTDLPAQAKWSYIYDSMGRLITTISPEGREYHVAYDYLGRPDSTWAIYNGIVTNKWKYQYDKLGNILKSTNPLGGINEYQYDELNRLTYLERAGESPISFDYGPNERVITQTDQNGKNTVSELDKNGKLIRGIDQAGYIKEFTYTERGQIDSIKFYHQTNPNSTYIENYNYYPTNRLAEIIYPEQAKNSFYYDPNGNLERVIDPLGLITSFEYNDAHNLPTSITRPGEGRSKMIYDDLNRIEQISEYRDNSNPLTTYYSYQDMNRSVIETPPEGGPNKFNVYQYSPDGNLSLVKLPTDKTTTKFKAQSFSEYDASNNLLKMRNSHEIEFGYRYNDLGDYIGMYINGVLNGDSISYNVNGTIKDITNANGVTRFKYRDDGKIDSLLYKDGSYVAYDYYDNGWIQKLKYSDGLVKEYSYDYLGNIINTTEKNLNGEKALVFTRDASGNIVEETSLGRFADSMTEKSVHKMDYYPNGMIKRIDNIHYIRGNITGHVDTIGIYHEPQSSSGAANHTDLCFTYNAYGQIDTFRTDGGFLEYYGYDNKNVDRLTKITNNSGEYTIEYDFDGYPKYLIQNFNSVIDTIEYDYDTEGWLKGVKSAYDGKIEFRYDGAGNLEYIIDSTTGAILEQRKFDTSNRLTQVLRGPITTDVNYDSRGNIISLVRSDGNSKEFVFDKIARLHTVKDNGQIVQSFEYDAVDRLISDSLSISGKTQQIEFMGRYPVNWTTESDSNLLIPGLGSGGPLAIFNRSSHVIPTWLFGSAKMTSDAHGKMVDQPIVRAPYGKLLVGNNNPTPFGFKGYYQHQSSDIYWAYTRHYDASLKYFLSPDLLQGSMFHPISMNSRRVFSNDPIEIIDFLGLQDQWGGSIHARASESGEGEYEEKAGWAMLAKALWDWLFGDDDGGGDRPSSGPNISPRPSPPSPPPSPSLPQLPRLPSMPDIPKMTWSQVEAFNRAYTPGMSRGEALGLLKNIGNLESVMSELDIPWSFRDVNEAFGPSSFLAPESTPSQASPESPFSPSIVEGIWTGEGGTFTGIGTSAIWNSDKDVFELRGEFRAYSGVKASMLDLELGIDLQLKITGEGFLVKTSGGVGPLKGAAAFGGQEGGTVSELEGGFGVGSIGPRAVGKWVEGKRVPTEQKFKLFGINRGFFGMGIGAEFQLRRMQQQSVLFKEPLILHAEVQMLIWNFQPRVNLTKLFGIK